MIDYCVATPHIKSCSKTDPRFVDRTIPKRTNRPVPSPRAATIYSPPLSFPNPDPGVPCHQGDRYIVKVISVQPQLVPMLVGKAGANIAKLSAETGVDMEILRSSSQVKIAVNYRKNLQTSPEDGEKRGRRREEGRERHGMPRFFS